MAHKSYAISFKELFILLVVAVLLDIAQEWAFSEVPDAKHLAAGIAGHLIAHWAVPILGGITFVGARAFYRSALKALGFILAWLLPTAILLGLILLGIKGSPAVAIVLGIAGAVVVTGLVSIVQGLRSLASSSDGPVMRDEENPWIVWSWGIPTIDPGGLPPGGFGEFEDTDKKE
jgi:hypothetical protein